MAKAVVMYINYQIQQPILQITLLLQAPNPENRITANQTKNDFLQPYIMTIAVFALEKFEQIIFSLSNFTDQDIELKKLILL